MASTSTWSASRACPRDPPRPPPRRARALDIRLAAVPAQARGDPDPLRRPHRRGAGRPPIIYPMVMLDLQKPLGRREVGEENGARSGSPEQCPTAHHSLSSEAGRDGRSRDLPRRALGPGRYGAVRPDRTVGRHAISQDRSHSLMSLPQVRKPAGLGDAGLPRSALLKGPCECERVINQWLSYGSSRCSMQRQEFTQL